MRNYKVVAIVILVVILIVAICVTLFVKKDKKSKLEMFETNEKRQEYLHQNLLILLDKITKIFKEYNITYFIHSGTLLGSVREESIIPHDDDIDIAVFPEDFDFILSKEFGKELAKYNLKAEMVMPKDVQKDIIKLKYLKANHGIFIDIFKFQKNKDKIEYSKPKCRELWPNGWFSIEEMFPFKEYRLNNLIVVGPSNPIPYLKRHYGNDWNVPKVRERNHNDIIKLDETCNGECV